MIWHIFKKDFRLLWHFAAGMAALGWLVAFLTYGIDHDTIRLSPMFNMLIIGQILACSILVATVVQTDAIPGVRQDWLIRPIKRRDLLLAKLLFVVLLVQGPIFLAELIEILADGFSPARALSAASLRSLFFLATFLVPSLAFASVTRNFTETIVAAVAAVVFFGGIIQGINLQFPWHWRLFGNTGVDWVLELAALATAAAGVAVVLAVQYFRRRTAMSRWLIGAFSLICILVNFAPWQPVFAIQESLSPDPGAAAPVRMEFQPGLGRYVEPSGSGVGPIYQRHNREEGALVYLPIQVAGLPSDAVLRSDLMTARLTDAKGNSQNLGTGSAPMVANDGAGRAENSTHPMVFVRDSLFSKLRDQPVRLELDYSLTLLRLHDAHAMAALDGRQTIEELGQCETHLNGSRTAVNLHCLQAGDTPVCANFFLEHPAGGERNPPIGRCEGGYAPFFLQNAPDAFRRPNVNLPFRDAADRWHLPVYGPNLRESQVVIRVYQPEAHFTRQVVIPEIRLGEWLAR